MSGKVRMETIRDAYNKFGSESEGIYLVFDGGPENNNEEMKVAQNKLFKYKYLFRQEYEDIYGLRKIFGENVRDYNYIRPHISLAGYTPFEAYSGMTGLKDIWKEHLAFLCNLFLVFL